MFTVVLFTLGLSLSTSFATDNVEQMWSHDITVASLISGETLADGDTILMTETEESCYSEYIQIELTQMSPLSWWKGVRLHTKADQGYYKPLTQIQDSQTPIVAMFHVTDLYTNDVVLWKAKSFGSHTAMYRINDAARNMKPGHRYTLYWLQD